MIAGGANRIICQFAVAKAGQHGMVGADARR